MIFLIRERGVGEYLAAGRGGKINEFLAERTMLKS